MFTGQAEEAFRFYLSIFPDSELVEVEHYGADEANGEGTIKRASFRLAGQSFICIDSPPMHAFGFTPSMSFFFDCATASQLDSLYQALSDGGEVFMPVAEYPFARRFAWLADRYGLSWQLNLALG
jgi:predicted 3-demethylubiquinone-9 3-methyltransferase (glyoxalase superfamily)